MPGVELVTESIERIEPVGVRTADGRLHELDVLVCATGFHVDSFVRPMTIRGLDGLLLDDVWKDRPSAYMSVAVPGFPNFLMKLVSHVERESNTYLVPSVQAATRFELERVEAAKHTVWATGCRSWYLDDRGIPFLWPFPFARFTAEMEQPRFEDYATG